MHEGCKRRGRMGQLARTKTGLGARQLKSWRAKLARQLCSWRAPSAKLVANFAWLYLASKKLASTQKTHILHHNNKATQPKAVKYQ